MRVIAGTARGVRLGAVPPGARPVSDRAREGLFSSLGDRVEGAIVLDLFAGTGALGIEALSRGAEHAVFVDRSGRATAAVRDNLERARLAERSTVRRTDALGFLARAHHPEGPFDLVFLDPPYDLVDPELGRICAALASGWLAEGWTVVLTRANRSSTPVIPVDWAVSRRLRYGDSLLTLFQEVRWA
ncbi:MAG: 16S rRNA (guanine(966)-N(2))-methyltransferase RsmD [Actinomycetota bacterium]